MDWIYFTPAALIAALLLFGPGTGILWALGIRRPLYFALTPAISLSVIAVAAEAFSVLQIRWHLFPVLMFSLALIAGVLGARIFIHKITPRESSPQNTSTSFAPLLAWAASALVLTGQFAVILSTPQNFAQEADNILHLNIIRDILNTGDASSLSVTSLILPEGSTSFYPAAFHAVASLIADLGQGAVVVGENAVLFALFALVWPLGVLALVSAIFRPNAAQRTPLLLAAALTSTACVGFPLTVFGLGGVFPFFTAFALVPGVLAVFIQLLRKLPSFETGWFALLFALPALILSHPSSAHTLVVLGLGWGIVTVTRLWHHPKVNAVALIVLAVIIAVFVIWFWLTITTSGLRHDNFGIIVAAGQLVLGSYNVLAFSPLVIVSFLAGALMVLARRQHRWWLISPLAAGGLYLLAAAMQPNPVRDALVGPWYGDPARIYAIYTLAIIPLAAYAIAQTWLWLKARSTGWNTVGRSVAVLFVIAGIVLSQSFAVPAQIARTAPIFQHHKADNGWLSLSVAEAQLIAELPKLIEPGAVIAGSHFTGASYAYALSNVEVLNPQYIWQPLRDPNKNIIHESLNRADEDPAVCAAVKTLNVRYVLDFGEFPRSADDPQAQLYRGLDNLTDLGLAEVVQQRGAAKLLKLTACWEDSR